MLLIVPLEVAAQEPTQTPEPTPTPHIVHGDSGDFIIEPTVSYGQAGIMVGLAAVVAGQMLVLGLEVATWLKR